jgi:predicted phage terminase large subunit-like protein
MSHAQYLQEFECSFEASMNGDIFKREYWKYYSELPLRRKLVVHSWDTAFKTGEEADYSACVQAVECDEGLYLTGVYRARLAFPELKRVVRAQHDAQFPNAVLIEDKASGQSLIQELKRDTSMPILAVSVDSDKVTRAHAASPFIEAGNVYLPENAPWAADFVEECAGFPNGAHDDQVDALTQLINWIRRRQPEPTLRVIELEYTSDDGIPDEE